MRALTDAMIRPMKPACAPLTLASASPRRRRLLDWLGVPFESTAVEIDESLDGPLAEDPEALARDLAQRKAIATREALAAQQPASAEAPDTVILAFDTIVVLGDRVLGKPADRDDARRMLAQLSGRTHDVVTGVAVLCPGALASESFAVRTPVSMRSLPADMLEDWLDGDEVLGCAGAYNIERHLASVELDQCFQNVAGLPLCHLYGALHRMPRGCASQAPTSPVAACDAARGVTCALGPRLVREAHT